MLRHLPDWAIAQALREWRDDVPESSYREEVISQIESRGVEVMSLAADAGVDISAVVVLYRHLLDLLGAKDHEDAARIIAGHHVRELKIEQSEECGCAGELHFACRQSNDTPRPPPPVAGFVVNGRSDPSAMVMLDLYNERRRQDAKWGVQNHPSFAPETAGWPVVNRARYYGIGTEDELRGACEGAFNIGHGSYAHIFMEEAAEAIGAEDEAHLREELVQCAAVAAAWIECIDRRSALAESQRPMWDPNGDAADDEDD